MANDSDEWLLEFLLLQYDILGSKGCHPSQDRRTLMVEIKGETPEFGPKAFSFRQWAPEGYGIEFFNKPFLDMPTDMILNEEELLIWNVEEAIPLNQRIWLFNVEETIFWNGHAGFTYIFDLKSTWSPVPDPQFIGSLRLLECYAGGFGGWKHAAKFIDHQMQVPIQVVAVEANAEIASQYALTHRANLISAAEPIPEEIFLLGHDWIVHSDVFNPNIRRAIHAWQPHVICISSPCPPWSGAAHSRGLYDADGKLLAQSILDARFIRPLYILLEQVGGFAAHPHKPLITNLLLFCGYQLIFQKILDLADVAQPTRVRWLGIAKRIHAQLPTLPMQIWKKNECKSFTNPMLNLPIDLRAQTEVTSTMEKIASDPRFCKGSKGSAPQQTLQAKIFEPTSPLPTFMAMYGSHHLLDPDLLQHKGFFGHFVRDTGVTKGYRLWHPSETILAHGVADIVHVPTDTALANRIVGNMISVQHALFLLTNMLSQLRQHSMTVHALFQLFDQKKYKAEECHLVPMSTGHMLMKVDMLLLTKFRTAATQIAYWKINLPKRKFWNSILGIMDYKDIQNMLSPKPLPPPHVSPVSEDDDIEPTWPDTLQWQPFIRGELQLEHSKHPFWYSADLSNQAISKVWDDQYKVQFQPIEHPITVVLTHPADAEDQGQTIDRTCAIFLADHELTLISATHGKALVNQDQVKSSATQLFDQFGPISSGQTADYATLLMDRPLQHATIAFDMVTIMGAFLQTQGTVFTQPSDSAICIRVQGDEQSKTLIMKFWQSTCTAQELERLGREVTMTATDVKFIPMSNSGGVAPNTCFKIALAVCATRSLFDQLQCSSTEGIELLIKWDGRPLWKGRLHQAIDVQTIAMILKLTLFPVSKGKVFRVVSNGKQQTPETTLHEIPKATGKDCVVLFAVMEIHGGGAKQQQKSIQQSAIATCFLEQGHPLEWTTKTVDHIISKVSTHRLQSITSHPRRSNRIQSLNQLCAELQITIPEAQTPQSRNTNTGAPWQKKKKREEQPIQIGEFSIVDRFFMNEDASPAQQLQHLRPQSTGISLMNDTLAAPLLRENQTLSSDELAVVVVGHKFPDNIASEEITFPCINNNGQRVLLCGRIYQLGTKKIKINHGSVHQIPSVICQLTAITLYKDNWTDAAWQEAVQNTMAFIRKVLQVDQLDKALQAIWGRSLRNGRAAASPIEATSIQVHATVEQQSFARLLQKSGYNKLFLTPKQQSGKPSTDYRILWVQGDMAKAIALGAQTTQCMGLVRGKNAALGLRFAQDDFTAAWKVVYPQHDVPSTFTGDHGTSQQMLTQWAQTNKWDCRPFRALGPTCWMVKANGPPPQELMMFNTSPLLIRPIQVRDSKKSRLVLGPRQIAPKPGTNEPDPWTPGDDPWARWQPPTSANMPTPTRAVQGPIEARFATQDQKIADLKAEIEGLAKKQDQQEQAVKEEFEIAHRREQEEFAKIQFGMKKIQQDLDTNLAQTMQAHSKSMENQFKELKSLFQNSMKRSKPADADESME